MKLNDHISFDLDDTLVGTRGWSLNRVIQNNANDKHLKREIDQLMQSRVPSQEQQQWLQDVIWDVLKDSRFMLHASPTLSLIKRMPDFKKWLERKIDEGKTLSVTTHRGWTPRGQEYSERWLEQYDLLKYFTDIHCISSSEHPNKLEYLSGIYGSNFTLFDDNPVHHKASNFTHLIEEGLVYICRTEHSFKHVNTLPGFDNWEVVMRS